MKKIIFGMSLLAVAGTMVSCNDFLNEEPELKQSNELTFSTFDGLNDAGAALYGMMQSCSWYDGEFILQSELRAGNAKNPKSEPGSGRYRQDTQWNYTENSTSPLWTYAYYTIARANNVINNLPTTDLGDATQEDANNLMAEALFMRALGHFDLVITYAQPYSSDPQSLGVPVDTVTVNGKPARNTVAEVYAQIEKDLLQAESLISDDYKREGVDDDAAVVSKQAIQALLSRVYLYMEQWQKAADYATKVINSGKYNLVDADDYKAMWSASVAAKDGEIIFEVYGSSKNSYWDASGWEHLPYILDRGNDGSADVCATQDLVEMYEEGDVRAELYELSNGDNFVLKYKGKEGAVPRAVNVPILRLAEYGVYPSWRLIARDPALLSGTDGADWYSTSLSAWYDDVIDVDVRLKELGRYAAMRMVSHERPAKDVSVTTYENGDRVYVNYGTKDVTVQNVTIPARSFTIKEVD